MEGVLLGIGNPLLDISAHVEKGLFDKYGLGYGTAILAEAKHLPLFTEMKEKYPVEYIAGGAAQNSIRAAQWMLQTPGACSYIGCVGDDENGKELKKAAEKDGLRTLYLVDKEKPTGTCACLIKDKERSLVANLGAAEAYKIEHLHSHDVQAVLNKAKYVYCTGFFLTHSPHVLVELGKHTAQHNKYLLMNISAPFLVDFFWDAMKQVLPYTDVVFANETEAETLGKKLGWGSDLDEIAVKLSAYPKENAGRTRTVVFTQGAKQTLVYHDGKLLKFTPLKCSPEEIVDTNGAGDSFVGGFLSRFVQARPLEECIAAAHYAAWECIRRSGATYPEKPSFTYP